MTEFCLASVSLDLGPLVVLLQPPGTRLLALPSGSGYPPLGLYQLAATVPSGLAMVLDAAGLGLDKAQTRAMLRALRPSHPRLVGMMSTADTLPMVEEYAAACGFLGISVLVCGPHASLSPRDVFMKCPTVEYVVRGSAVAVFPEILGRLAVHASLRGLPGLCFQHGDRKLHLEPAVS